MVNSAASAAPPAITYLYPAGAQRGTTADVAVAGTLDASTKVWASGKGVSVESGKGKFKVTVAKDAIPGTYWLRAHNAEGASTLRPFVVGTLPEVMEKEPNDEPKKPHVLEASSVVVNGKLEKPGDVDCFAVTLKKGQTLVASLEANHALRSPMDAILQVVSADGFVLSENNDYHGLDPQIAHIVPADGTYLVRVYAFPAMPDSSIRFAGGENYVYRLTITTEGFADYVTPVAVERGKTADVKLHGWNIPEQARKTAVRVPADADDVVPVFSTVLRNTPRLVVEPHPTFDHLAPFDPKTRAKPYEPPFSSSGIIQDAVAPERHAVVVKMGQPLDIEVRSASLGQRAAPVLRILGKKGDERGAELAKAEPPKLHADTTLTFNPPYTGVVQFHITDQFKGSGTRYAYLLRVTPAEPDYSLSVAADRFAVAPGKPTTIPVKVNRRAGFAKTVEIVAEGLPEGVKFEVTTPAKPDPNTVTLTLTPDKPVSGAFRLVGKVKDEPKLTRMARAALPEFDTATPDLWLTVTAAPPPPKKSG